MKAQVAASNQTSEAHYRKSFQTTLDATVPHFLGGEEAVLSVKALLALEKNLPALIAIIRSYPEGVRESLKIRSGSLQGNGQHPGQKEKNNAVAKRNASIPQATEDIEKSSMSLYDRVKQVIVERGESGSVSKDIATVLKKGTSPVCVALQQLTINEEVRRNEVTPFVKGGPQYIYFPAEKN